MKYWGVLLAKLAAATAVLYGIWLGMYNLYPFAPYYAEHNRTPFMHDLTWTSLMFAFHILCNAVLFFIILDQRYRCRKCGRRLRMPVSTGSHAHVILGPPRTDYICIYGHGTLKVPELDLTGHERPDWKKNDDNIWKELLSMTGKGKTEN